MSARLEKLGAEREKARLKRDEWDARYKELDRKYKAQENVEIHDIVHAANMTPDELADFLKHRRQAAASADSPEENRKFSADNDHAAEDEAIYETENPETDNNNDRDEEVSDEEQI